MYLNKLRTCEIWWTQHSDTNITVENCSTEVKFAICFKGPLMFCLAIRHIEELSVKMNKVFLLLSVIIFCRDKKWIFDELFVKLLHYGIVTKYFWHVFLSSQNFSSTHNSVSPRMSNVQSWNHSPRSRLLRIKMLKNLHLNEKKSGGSCLMKTA